MIVLVCALLVLSTIPMLIVAVQGKRYYLPYLIALAFYSIQIVWLTNATSGFSEETVVRCAVYATICNFMLAFFLKTFEGSIRKIEPLPVTADRNGEAIARFSLVALITLYVGIKYNQGDTAFLNVWEQREAGDSGFMAPALTYIGFMVFVLWSAVRGKAIKLATLPFLLFIFATTGARIIFIVVFGAVWFFTLRRYKLRTILPFTPIAAVILLTVHVVSRAIRSAGAGALLSGDFSAVTESLTADNLDFTGGDGSIAEGFAVAMQLFTTGQWQSPPFATLSRIVLMPFPTAVVGIKPPDITYTLWGAALQFGYFDQDQYFSSLVESYALGQNGSLHPIIWGDALLNAGWLGCFLWPLLVAVVLVAVERAVVRHRNNRYGLMVAALSAPALLYLVRGNVFLGLCFFILLPLFWLVFAPKGSRRSESVTVAAL